MMPYKRVGRVIYSKSGGKWHVKQVCTSIQNAIKALRLLRMKEHQEEE